MSREQWTSLLGDRGGIRLSSSAETAVARKVSTGTFFILSQAIGDFLKNVENPFNGELLVDVTYTSQISVCKTGLLSVAV